MILRLIKEFEDAQDVHVWGKTEFKCMYALCGDWAVDYEFLGAAKDVTCAECLDALHRLILSDTPPAPAKTIEDKDDSEVRFSLLELE